MIEWLSAIFGCVFQATNVGRAYLLCVVHNTSVAILAWFRGIKLTLVCFEGIFTLPIILDDLLDRCYSCWNSFNFFTVSNWVHLLYAHIPVSPNRIYFINTVAETCLVSNFTESIDNFYTSVRRNLNSVRQHIFKLINYYLSTILLCLAAYKIGKFCSSDHINGRSAIECCIIVRVISIFFWWRRIKSSFSSFL